MSLFRRLTATTLVASAAFMSACGGADPVATETPNPAVSGGPRDYTLTNTRVWLFQGGALSNNPRVTVGGLIALAGYPVWTQLLLNNSAFGQLILRSTNPQFSTAGWAFDFSLSPAAPTMPDLSRVDGTSTLSVAASTNGNTVFTATACNTGTIMAAANPSVINGALVAGSRTTTVYQDDPCLTTDNEKYVMYQISLDAGKSVTLEHNSGAYDAWLNVYNQNGIRVASDDDAGPGLDSFINFTNTTGKAAKFWVMVGSLTGGGATGAFTFKVGQGFPVLLAEDTPEVQAAIAAKAGKYPVMTQH